MDKSFYEEKGNTLGFSKSNLDDDRLLEICNMMKAYNPVWINTQPSMAMLMAQCFKQNKLGKMGDLKYIELTGEMLFDNVREEIEEVFGCITANQYGCNEANSIAYECPYGNMHCMEDNVFVEILDNDDKVLPDEKEGNIVITTLNSHITPFIRYRIGDLGKIKRNQVCQCGNCSPILTLTSGRISDFALMEDGSRVSSYVFVRAVELVNSQYENVIKQFKVEQKSFDSFIIYLSLDEEMVCSESDRKGVEKFLLQSMNDTRLYSAKFAFQYSDLLKPDKDERKLRYFVRGF